MLLSLFGIKSSSFDMESFMKHLINFFVCIGFLTVMAYAKEGVQTPKAPQWVNGDLRQVQVKGYKNWGLGRSGTKIFNEDTSTALKIAFMGAQRKITNNLYHTEYDIPLENGEYVSCCFDYYSAIMIKVQLATDKQAAQKISYLEYNVYNHIVANITKIATWVGKDAWSGKDTAYVLAGIKQDKLRQICAYFDPKSQTIACQIEQGLIKTK
ncbi:hypothetical protein [Helicobacter felis]|uniref:hypothetical protein n=2 Tax=Helicobacter felis TaxID=214 RepID=UPI001F4358F1|nr:hypothetical protein [Helicobacter felis]